MPVNPITATSSQGARIATAILLAALTAGTAVAQVLPPYGYRIPLEGINARPATPSGGEGGETDPGQGTPLTLTLSGPLPTEAMVGYAITPIGITVAGGTGAKTYGVIGVTWMSFGAGGLSGTPGPGSAGQTNYQVSVSAGSETKSEQGSITVYGQFLPSVSGPTTATEGENASVAIASTGGKAPISYGIEYGPGGPVPGMAFAGNALTGAPTTPGSYSFTLWAQDSFLGQRFEQQRSLTVNANPYALTLAGGQVSVRPGTVQTRAASTTVPNPTYSLIGAPDYVAIAPTTGVITVTGPSVAEAVAMPGFTIRAQNAQDASQRRELQVSGIGVARPQLALTSASVTGTIGQPIAPVAITLTGAQNPGAPSITGPNGLLGLTISNGQIQGTPTRADNTTRTVTYVDQADNASVSATVSLSIAETLTVALPATTTYTGTTGQTITAGAPSHSGAVGTVSWTIEGATGQAAPAGTSVNATTGVVTATSAASGDLVVRLRAQDTIGSAVGQSATTGTMTFQFRSPDASTARPNSASAASDVTWFPGGSSSNPSDAVTRFYDNLTTTGVTIFGGSYGGYPHGAKLTYNSPTQIDCAVVSASGQTFQISSNPNGTWTTPVSSSGGTIGLTPGPTRNIEISYGGARNNNLRIYEFRAGVMQQNGTCKTAP